MKQAFGDVVDIFNEPILKQIAEKYKKTVAQIILNFQLKRGVSVLPKSTNEDRLKENLNCADFILQEEDQKLIFGLDKGYRTINPKKNQNKLFYPLFD